MKKLISIITILIVLLFPCISVSAENTYNTYTYSRSGEPIRSPDAFLLDEIYDGNSIGAGKLNEPQDIFVSKSGEVFIADTGNNRIVVLDNNFKMRLSISEFYNTETNSKDGFNLPKGLYVTTENLLYVADTENSRIVVLDADDASFVRSYDKPETNLLEEYMFKPASLVVDASGRIYTVADGINLGVVGIENDGGFAGLKGAQQVKISLIDLFWRNFMTAEQIARTAQYVPISYNNIAIDDEDFLFLTSATDTPVKMINPSGIDVLSKLDEFDPIGDVKVEEGNTDEYGPSEIIDVAVGPSGTYSILDGKRNKIFTYDSNGFLLFAFGGTGSQQGIFTKAVSICYDQSSLLVLDSVTGSISVFKTTEFGSNIFTALDYYY